MGCVTRASNGPDHLGLCVYIGCESCWVHPGTYAFLGAVSMLGGMALIAVDETVILLTPPLHHY